MTDPSSALHSLHILGFEVGPLQENTYLAGLRGEAVLVDPGFVNKSEFDRFAAALEQNNWTLKAVLLTHAHVDHVAGLPYVLDVWPEVDVFLSDRNRGVWQTLPVQSELFGVPMRPLHVDPKPFPSGGLLQVGNLKVDVLHTPGHSPDHCAFWFRKHDVLISGDVLFKESIGRTDIYGGDAQQLTRSIRDVVYALPDNVRVLPGHGPETTVGWEKSHNPFVQAAR